MEQSEIKFQGDLDQPRGTRRGGKSKLGGAALDRKILVRGHLISKRQVRVIPDIEEFSAKLKMHLFVNRELFDKRHIPVLQSGTADDVSSRVAKSSECGVSNKCASVKERSRNAGFAIRIAHYIRTRAIENLPAAVGVRKID
jgi:hypothetical protein